MSSKFISISITILYSMTFHFMWIQLAVCKTWSPKKKKQFAFVFKVWEVNGPNIPVKCSQVLYTRLQAGTVLRDLFDAPTVVFTIKPTQPYFSPISNGPIRAPRAGLGKRNLGEKTLDRPCKHTAGCHQLHTGLSENPPGPHDHSAHHAHDQRKVFTQVIL